MKRIVLILLCILMIASACVVGASAGRERIDIRELEEYGQLHYYLGAPAKVRPNVEDASVKENEYAVTYEFKPDDKYAFIEWPTDSPKYCDNEWARVHISYDENNLYLAMETKDKNYVQGSDGVSFNISFRNSGIGYDAISRMCFDLFQHPEAVEEDISTFNAKCRYLIKNEKGEWDNPPSVDGLEYITDISGKYDKTTEVFTVELEIYLDLLLEFWDNKLPLSEVRMLIYPFVWMHGESAPGAGDEVRQGLMWNYLKVSKSELPELVTKLYEDYNYQPPWLPHIVHFCEDPAFTTTPPATTEPQVTTQKLEPIPFTSANPVVTTTNVTTAPATTAEEQKGCGSTLSVSMLPIAFITVGCLVAKKKKD